MGLLISSVLLIFAETKFVTHSANQHVSRFYADDFRQIKTRTDLMNYLKLTLPEKWQNQDENGNQNEYSRNNGIVHITELGFQVQFILVVVVQKKTSEVNFKTCQRCKSSS